MTLKFYIEHNPVSTCHIIIIIIDRRLKYCPIRFRAVFEHDFIYYTYDIDAITVYLTYILYYIHFAIGLPSIFVNISIVRTPIYNKHRYFPAYGVFVIRVCRVCLWRYACNIRAKSFTGRVRVRSHEK